MSYTAVIDDIDDLPVSGCGCGWKGTVSQCAPIGTCILTPGDPSPAGRCPECDSLVYVEDNSKFTQDSLEVRLTVKAYFSITCGLYSGPLTREIIAKLIDNQIEAAGGIEPFLTGWSIDEISLDSGASLARST